MTLTSKKPFVAGFILGRIAGWTTPGIVWPLIAGFIVGAFYLGFLAQKFSWL